MNSSGTGGEGGDSHADKEPTTALANLEGGRHRSVLNCAKPVKINWEQIRQEDPGGEPPINPLSVEMRKGNSTNLEKNAGLTKKLQLVEGDPITTASPDNARKLFFKPLNKHSTREHILTCLEKFGKIEYLRVPYSNKKRKNLGYGFVVFESQTTSELLHRHQIKTKIDDKIVGFTRFDMLKYKSKRNYSKCSSDAEELDLNSLSIPRPELGSGIQIDIKNHFLKPTNKKYYSSKRTMQGAKYKFNLERLVIKEMRDANAAIFLSKLRSTAGTL